MYKTLHKRTYQVHLFSPLSQHPHTPSHTLTDKNIHVSCLATHEKGRRSASLLLFQFPVCLYPPPPSILCSCTSSSISCLYASPSADKSFIPGRPGALQLRTLLQTRLFAWERCVMSYVHMTLFWHCSEWLVVLILRQASSLHLPLFAWIVLQTMTQRLTHATKQDAGPLCHQLMITTLLPESLEQAVIRDIVFRRGGGGCQTPAAGAEHGAFQGLGKSNCLQHNSESVSCVLESRGGNSSLLTAQWHRATEMWFSGCWTFYFSRRGLHAAFSLLFKTL